MIKITNIKIYLLKYKNRNPVLSSFGNIKFRSSLVIEIHDENNNNGIVLMTKPQLKLKKS